MRKTAFHISKMDCASDEQLIRMKLEGLENVSALRFDIPNRRLDVYHARDHDAIAKALDALRLDAKFVETSPAGDLRAPDDTARQRRLLRQVLAINFFFFALEMLAGFFSNSMGLVADSLDMLADSLVYGLALFAVGGTVAGKKTIAKASGYLQMLLAALGFIEVVRRFAGFGEAPSFRAMMIVSALALVGNTLCLYLLQKSKSREAHMRASMIFTSNDIVINAGVIAAGGLVFLTNSKFPDLIVGTIIFVIVARGAFKILQLSK